jgi:DNA-directed RNA polymerase subunit M/transcription elongation factor TFIIS
MTVTVEFYVNEKKRKEAFDTLYKHVKDKKCKLIEDGIYNFSKEYCLNHCIGHQSYQSVYDHKLNDIIFNIDNSESLVEFIKNNNNNPYNIAYLSPEELNSLMWKKQRDKAELTEYKAKNMATTDRYPCKICKARKATVRQIQLSSGDEPMTTFITCTVCKNVVKFRA